MLDRDGKLVQKTRRTAERQGDRGGHARARRPQTNAEIVRVDPDKALGVDNVAQVKDIPGVDLTTVPADKRTDVLLALNAEACNCGCGLTVAKCRIDDPTCTVSLPIAQDDRRESIAQPQAVASGRRDVRARPSGPRRARRFWSWLRIVAATGRANAQPGRGADNGVRVQSVRAIEILDVARLAEALDTERLPSLATGPRRATRASRDGRPGR